MFDKFYLIPSYRDDIFEGYCKIKIERYPSSNDTVLIKWDKNKKGQKYDKNLAMKHIQDSKWIPDILEIIKNI